MRELQLWAQLADHPNVASLADVGREFGMPLLLLPYADLGNLAEHVKRRLVQPAPAVAPEEVDTAAWVAEPLDWMIQLAFGVRFLHDSAVVHGDLKPQNVLVYSTATLQFPHIKICDLGLSAKGAWWTDCAELPSSSHQPSPSSCETLLVSRQGHGVCLFAGFGSADFRAPELKLRNHAEDSGGSSISEKCDMWAFGTCLLYSLSGGLPADWQDANAAACLRSFRRAHRSDCGQPQLVLGVADEMHEALISFVEASLAHSPLERPSASNAIETLIEVFEGVADGQRYFRRVPPRDYGLYDSERWRREMVISREVLDDSVAAQELEEKYKRALADEAKKEEEAKAAAVARARDAGRQSPGQPPVGSSSPAHAAIASDEYRFGGEAMEGATTAQIASAMGRYLGKRPAPSSVLRSSAPLKSSRLAQSRHPGRQ
uniref:Protein kinase domain-containing protein n=1 Tax=Haptolina brevifila TaxID=156173 RepID=A0A7S2E5V6_9EUKA